jgi:hypothetical protein
VHWQCVVWLGTEIRARARRSIRAQAARRHVASLLDRHRSHTAVTARQSGSGTSAPRAWVGEPDNKHRCAEARARRPEVNTAGHPLLFGWWASLQHLGGVNAMRGRRRRTGGGQGGQTAREEQAANQPRLEGADVFLRVSNRRLENVYASSARTQALAQAAADGRTWCKLSRRSLLLPRRSACRKLPVVHTYDTANRRAARF